MSALVGPMLLFCAVMMLSMVLSGVYRADVANSVVRLYGRTVVAYAIASGVMFALALIVNSENFSPRFLAIALAFSFFVLNTFRPVIVEGRRGAPGDRRASYSSTIPD
jgi:flagellar biosynthesis component FlhA